MFYSCHQISSNAPVTVDTWWRHQIETFSALLALCAGYSPVIGDFPSQRQVTQSFAVLFDLRLNKRLSKQSRRMWFETPSSSLWRHCHANITGIWSSNELVWFEQRGDISVLAGVLPHNWSRIGTSTLNLTPEPFKLSQHPEKKNLRPLRSCI